MLKNHLRAVIQSTLSRLGLEKSHEYLNNSIELLLATAAQESHMGKYLFQIGDGGKPIENGGLGPFQMESATHKDIYDNYLAYKKHIRDEYMFKATGIEIKDIQGMDAPFDIDFLLVGNLSYAIVMARLQYYRTPDMMPNSQDIEGAWTMYKINYNTPLGKATKEEFYENSKLYGLYGQ